MTILMRFIFSLIVIALLFVVDVYFFQSLKTVTSGWPALRRVWTYRIYWGVSAFSLLFMLFASLTWQHPVLPKFVQLYTFCVIMVMLIAKISGIVPLLIDDIVRLGRWLAGFFNEGVELSNKTNGISRATFLSYTAIGLAAIPFGTMLYGMIKTAFDFTARRLKVTLPNLPAGFEGLKIVQISDIHSGSFMNGKSFERAVQMIMDEKPDIIFFTGDLVNDRSSEAEPHIDIWKQLSAPLGVFSIYGNHDYGDYVQWDTPELKAANLENLASIHKKMGWDLLRNEHRILERNGDKIGLIGVENWGDAGRFPKFGDINKARAGMENVPVKLLLSHDPSHWNAHVRQFHKDINVTFSGHTHGFQFGIEIPGFKWSPSQFVYKQWAGLYSSENQHIYVNRGLGFLGYLGRVGIKPEITVMELSSKA